MTHIAKRKQSAERLPRTAFRKTLRHVWNDRLAYLIFLPVLLNFLIFHYLPMWGARIAFMQYSVAIPIDQSPWIGLQNFKDFFTSYYFWDITRNTLVVGLYSLIFGFPAPILLAMLVNEIKSKYFKKALQTISYMPYFISSVIMVGMLFMLLNPTDGIFNMLLKNITGKTIDFMGSSQWFRSVYIGMGLWASTGFSAIIYLATISGIDPQLYEAAIIDGAGRISRLWHITFKSMIPTIAILFILAVGSILGNDWLRILLMQNSMNDSVSEVIQTFVYKRGMINADYSYATAVGLLMSVIGFITIMVSNAIVKRMTNSEMSLF